MYNNLVRDIESIYQTQGQLEIKTTFVHLFGDGSCFEHIQPNTESNNTW